MVRISIDVARMGAHAARALLVSREARVVAVFDKAIYAEIAGSLVCIGGSDIGDGPINAIATDESVSSWFTAFQAEHGIVVNSRGAVTWLPPPWPDDVGCDEAQRAAKHLRQLIAAHAPLEGLSRLSLDRAAPSSALTRLAGPRIANFRKWLSCALGGGAAGDPPVDLLGLGPGLTPSGDDVIGGACIALAAMKRTDVLQRLARAISNAVPQATSPISAAILNAAVEGLGSAHFHDALIALLAALSDQAVGDRVLRAANIGATSGWDALAGTLLVFEMCSSTPSR